MIELRKEYRKTKRYRVFRRKSDKVYYDKADKKKLKARWKLNGELKTGKAKKKPCEVCGKEKVEAHHPNYSKPLEVVWLCHKHHRVLEDRWVY
jgi:hypothetical protein